MDNISGELLSAAVAIGVGVGALVRTYIRHRTRLQLERELSARAAVRALGLARLTDRHETVLIDERDRDGHRVVRMRGRRDSAAGPGDRSGEAA